MGEANEERITAGMAKIMALMCVRNTMLEDIHAGIVPVSNTGDFTDVVVIDGDGRKIPWRDVSHFDDDAMRDLMRQIVNRLYTFHLKSDDPSFQRLIDRWELAARKWDDPNLDASFLRAMEQFRETWNDN